MPDNSKQLQFMETLKKRKKLLILIIVVVILLVLAVFTTREPTGDVKTISVKSYSISETWVLFELTLDVDNPNIIGGTLNSLEADIYYNNQYIGHATTTEKYDIKALGKSTIKVDLRIDNLPSSFTPLPPTIRAQGVANVSVSFLTFDLEFDKTVDD